MENNQEKTNVELILEQNRIGVKDRNKIQVELMRLMCSTEDLDEQSIWVDKYSKEVHFIIDDPKNEHIRELLRIGDYKESAKLVKQLLEKGERDEHKIAA